MTPVPFTERNSLPLEGDEDIDLLAGALSTSYAWALDALAHSLLHGGRPRKDPNIAAVERNRKVLDRIERLSRDLGRPLNTARRSDIDAKASR